MNIQKSKGDFAPNTIGSNNQINQNSKNIKTSFGCKARYTLLGFILGIASSYLGSYLYDNYKIVKSPNISQQEIVEDAQKVLEDSIK